MFGYILVNPKTLSKAEKARYREAYCGLCRELRAYGAEGRAALSYDMTFIALLLHSVYELEEVRGAERCAMRPAPVHRYFTSEATAYAADMNILFSYYNDLDDWNDDRDARARERYVKLERYLPAIAEKWPAQAGRVTECMERLAQMERQNVLNPDEPANCFGAMMGEIFDWRGEAAGDNINVDMPETDAGGQQAADDAPAADGGAPDPSDTAPTSERHLNVAEPAPIPDSAQTSAPAADGGAPDPSAVRGVRLRRMGEALGRFLYLLDASNDLLEDIRKERYNPLIAQMNTNFEPLLAMMIGECTREFEKLAPERDSRLLKNVLYSGVWMKYRKGGRR